MFHRPRPRIALAVVLALALIAPAVRAQDEAPPADAAPVSAELQWPRVIEDGDITFTVYQPQIDKFDDTVLEARAAVQVETKRDDDKTQTTYGVIWIKANTFIDKESGPRPARRHPDRRRPTSRRPATRPTSTSTSSAATSSRARTISLDRIEANLAITQADKKGNAVPLKNDPPKIYYRTSPAILVLIDGDPVLRAVEGSRPPARPQHAQPDPEGRRRLLHADRRPLGHGQRPPWAPGGWPRAVPAPRQAMRDAIAKDENQSQADLMRGAGRRRQGSCSPRADPGHHRQHRSGRAHRDRRASPR